jgi:hypothetical protein
MILSVFDVGHSGCVPRCPDPLVHVHHREHTFRRGLDHCDFFEAVECRTELLDRAFVDVAQTAASLLIVVGTEVVNQLHLKVADAALLLALLGVGREVVVVFH